MQSFSLFLALVLTVACAVPGHGARPNVLFILVDDLGWSDLACYGNDLHETPNVDRLAREGMLFTDFYAAGPVCSPTRASILTGKSPARTGITTYLLSPERDARHVTTHLPLQEMTLAEAMRAAGTVTGYFGKWHLGYRAKHWATQQGFDVAIGGMDLPNAWRLAHPEQTAPPLDRAQGHTRFYSPHHLTWMENGPEGEYLTDRLTTETIRFIESQGERAFFAFLSFHTVHTPLQAKPETIAKYRKKIESSNSVARIDEPRLRKPFKRSADYAAMVEHLDMNVGRLLAALRRLGREEDTIVVFVSDNGGKGSVTSNLPLRGAKHNLYEGGIRVPAIIRWPGRIRAGARCSAPIITDDFYPTLLDLCALPRQPHQHVDGVSFANLLHEEGVAERKRIHWHYPHSKHEAAVRIGHFKLLFRFKTGSVELYNLELDIGEQNDLSVELPNRTQEMLSELVRWQEEVGARFEADGKPL